MKKIRFFIFNLATATFRLATPFRVATHSLTTVVKWKSGLLKMLTTIDSIEKSPQILNRDVQNVSEVVWNTFFIWFYALIFWNIRYFIAVFTIRSPRNNNGHTLIIFNINFLKNFVTGVETWWLWYDPFTKSKNRCRHFQISPQRKNFAFKN